MTDQEFQERVLAWIERTEDWETRTDNRIDNLEERMGTLQEGVSWIRGKLEGKSESDAALWGKIAVLAAVGSAIIALLAYFK